MRELNALCIVVGLLFLCGHSRCIVSQKRDISDLTECRCNSTFIGDGVCDVYCYVSECNYDDGDCEQECAPGCTMLMLGNRICEPVCNNTPCRTDGGDCYCAPGCQPDWLGDQFCDYQCNNSQCNYDNQDCTCGILGVCQDSTDDSVDLVLIGALVGVIGSSFLAAIAGIGFLVYRIRKRGSQEIPLNILEYGFDMKILRTATYKDFCMKVTPKNGLTFNLGGHQAPVETPLKDVLKLRNRRRHKVHWAIHSESSPKFTFEFSPLFGSLEIGYEVEIEVTLTIHCTTKIDTNILVVSSKEEGEHSTLTPSVYFPMHLQIESMLSTSIDSDELQLQTAEIGEGSFGVVFRRGQEVAVKRLKKQEGKTTIEEFTQEMKTLESVRCPQIIHYFGSVRQKGKLALVTVSELLSHCASHLFEGIYASGKYDFLHQESSVFTSPQTKVSYGLLQRNDILTQLEFTS
ncbi:hypothetical protein Pelo_2971 [Pelomyxa schiedti]|nr:hypothetical protein Pelo_2971 [Pelomyxa schiedti]